MQGDQLLHRFFSSAVWLLVGLTAYRAVLHLGAADEIVGAYPGGYDLRVLLGPLVLLLAELFLWYRFFRFRKRPARAFAGIVGAYVLLMVIAVNLITADLYGREVPVTFLWLYLYAGAGHLAYALFGADN
jgi:membrane protease YdiL (CAAX protease family)